MGDKISDKKFQHILGRQKADREAVTDLTEETIFERALEMRNHFIHRMSLRFPDCQSDTAERRDEA